MSEGRKFGFSVLRHPNRSGREWLSDADFHDCPERLDRILGLGRALEPWAHDLLLVARAVFLVDKRFLREVEDGWTRSVDLMIEVAEPDLWGEAQIEDLTTLLSTLTGDAWKVHVTGGTGYAPPLDFEHRAGEVALFSGGLDSTSYAAQAATREGAGELLLIGYDDNVHSCQREIKRAIDEIARRPIRLVQVGQRPLSASKVGVESRSRLESSSRTRGLLYMATAVAAAAANRVGQIKVPENGQLAINPPLSPNRLGALSTRSVHPWTVDRMNRLIGGLGGSVTVVNPLLSYTKGEVCKQALGAGLSRTDLECTVSCGDPSSGRYHGNVLNCGHCYPCLVRRSGLLFASGRDATEYRSELASADGADAPLDHLRALMRWLATDFGLRDLVADMPFPRVADIPEVLPMLHDGRRELAAMVEHIVAEEDPLRRDWAPRLAG